MPIVFEVDEVADGGGVVLGEDAHCFVADEGEHNDSLVEPSSQNA